MPITVASPRIVAGSGSAAGGRLELEEQALMAHDQHRHDHDRGLMTKLHWLLRIRHFWMSDVNRAVVDLADPKPGERGWTWAPAWVPPQCWPPNGEPMWWPWIRRVSCGPSAGSDVSVSVPGDA